MATEQTTINLAALAALLAEYDTWAARQTALLDDIGEGHDVPLDVEGDLLADGVGILHALVVGLRQASTEAATETDLLAPLGYCYNGGDGNTIRHDEAGIEVGIWRSAGTDGAWVVQVDTSGEPDDLPLRVNVNDGAVWGRAYSDE